MIFKSIMNNKSFRNVGLTTLVSGAITAGIISQLNGDREYRDSLKTPEVVEAGNITSDISDPCWVYNNQELYKSQSKRYAQLLEDERTRQNINELTEIETGPVSGYTLPLTIVGMVFLYSSMIAFGETVHRIGAPIEKKIKSYFEKTEEND